MRRSGVLLSISSLPSKYGIGSMGEEAYRFVRFLCNSGQKLWQVLPIGPTGYGDSPYQSFSSFAGNPYFIDLDVLRDEGLLLPFECQKESGHYLSDRVDYGTLYLTRLRLLRKAYERADLTANEDFIRFRRDNGAWVEDYALFMAIKEVYENVSVFDWPEKLRKRDRETLDIFIKKHYNEVEFYIFLQYHFRKQWFGLKRYANEHGIEIVGDIPIYVALDSADVWTHPELFELDEALRPLRVAGCPPDAFSEDGQLWGNPVYCWERQREKLYDWWTERIRACAELFDIVRIDHFRGFESFFAISWGQATAKNGVWEQGPGEKLFDELEKRLGKLDIIAEDLGYITDEVRAMLKRTGFPGMKLLQFSFDSREHDGTMPFEYEKNCVVYTGTHDNNTVLGWYAECDEKDRRRLREYLNLQDESGLVDAAIRCCFASAADTVVIPMQDYLGLGPEGRMNTPSVLGGNWVWRMSGGEYTENLQKYIKRLTEVYRR